MTEPTFENTNQFAVFEHKKRREWGLGIIAWERTHKRGYVFENGQLRILASEFYSLMREVDRPHDEVQALYTALKPELDAARAEEGPILRTRKQSATVMSFDDQLSIFRAEYPGGFEDNGWAELQRGTNAKKRLSRHRDSAISHARARLGAEEIQGRLAQQQFRGITTDLVAVLRQTDLVPGPELTGLQNDDTDRRQDLAVAVGELLHGEAAYGTRFERFVAAFEAAFGRAPGWQLATALSALVHPNEHICVRPTSFREQAKWMAPRLAIARSPTAANYARCLSMATLVLAKLGEYGESPRDLMDVYDFMRVTTRPAAKQLLAKLKQAKKKQPGVGVGLGSPPIAAEAAQSG